MFNAQPKFAFFGTSEFSVKVLNILIENDYTPDLVITVPDKHQGRKMVLISPPIKVFAQAHNLKIEQPNSLSGYKLSADGYQLFIVASYGKIIPRSILNIPKFGTLNVHPSLLPKFRGSSPIQYFILSGEEETGVTIMQMDEEVDHGPVLAQRKFSISNLQFPNYKKLEEKLAGIGGEMLIDIIPKWINGEIKPQEQDHNQATFTKKITKEDGLVDLEKDNPEIIHKKFLAFYPWPGIYFFIPIRDKFLTGSADKADKKIRVIITDMKLSESGGLIIKRVKPEGKKEMLYEDFLRGYKKRPF